MNERAAALGDVAELIRGVSYRPADLLTDVPHAVHLLRATNIGNRSLDLADVLNVPSTLVRDSQILRRFDVVIAMSSGSRLAVGRLAQLRQNWAGCVGAFCGVIRPKPSRVDPEYLGYVLQSPDFRAHIEAHAEGTAIMNLSRERLFGFPVVLPTLAGQRRIAHILGTLDDKIELNRRTNETLEAIARALFKSWFVDFDPVRAKSEGRDPGLPPHLADLFPDSFEDSELGEIPTGWRLGRFGDVVAQLRDQENPPSSPDALFHHFSIPAFDEGQSPRPEYGESIKSLKLRVPTGVILLSKLNPEIERVWVVDVGPGERAVCSTEFLVLRALPPYTRTYAYCLARSPLFRQQIESLVTGTSKSHQRAQVESILNLAVVIPSSPVVEAFDDLAGNLLARTLDCRRESHTLAGLRDVLLPKLVSGELRLHDADRLVETAPA